MDLSPQPVPQESKDGYYEVFSSQEGKKIIVLEGLSIQNQYDAPKLQLFIHEHYAVFSTFYWVLMLVVFLYLVGTRIVIPCLKR